MTFSKDEIKGLIRGRVSRNQISLSEAVESLRANCDSETLDSAAEELLEEAGELRHVTEDIPAVSGCDGQRDWYLGPPDDQGFWPSVKRHLESKPKHRPAVDSIDRESTRVMLDLPDPSQSSFSGRGLVVGHVQSGKTANFTAVMAKAADAGYRFIVILAGMTDALRVQTQRRIERDLIEIDDVQKDRWVNLTAEGDLEEESISPQVIGSQDHCCVAVIKKNHHRVQRLIRILENMSDQRKQSCPILIIDDECDQASVNSARVQEERTTTNRLLVNLLRIPPKIAYVGYTATPYANMLTDIDEADLYPSDFIISLKTPPDYFGAEKLFGRHSLDGEHRGHDDGLDMIRSIPQEENDRFRLRRNEKETWRIPITQSLQHCLRYFLMAASARRIRGDAAEHCALMIHTTFYSQPHENSRPVIEGEVVSIGDGVSDGDPDLLESMRLQWEREQHAVSSNELGLDPVGFADLIAILPSVAQDMQYFVENGSSDHRLGGLNDEGEYEENFTGGPAIVIGGNVLARGLTIDGLVCSFFVRSSSYYDSLMQMGRWFGYRRGYEDLPRIWMAADLEQHFKDLATVEHEVRLDIERYSKRTPRITPRELGPRIRLTPGLQVTSPQKIRSGKVEGKRSFDGRILQTTTFRTGDHDWLAGNLQAGERLLDRCSSDAAENPRPRNGLLFTGVPWPVVKSFFDEYRIHPDHIRFTTDDIKAYTEQQQQHSNRASWNIFVPSKKTGPEFEISDMPARKIGLLTRTCRTSRGKDGKDIGVLLDRKDAMSDFPEHYDGDDDLETIKRMRGDGAECVVSDPLLMLYYIDKDSSPPQGSGRKGLSAEEHVLGIALAFPNTRHPIPVEYITPDLGDDPMDEELGPDDADLEAEIEAELADRTL